MNAAERNIVCLADDLTGLAEIAALAANAGVAGSVFFDSRIDEPLGDLTEDAAIFINLACRNRSAIEVHEILRDVLHRLGGNRRIDHLYLKVDSAARGPVGSMLQGLMDELSPGSIPLVLANPDTKRSVRSGLLYVDGQPIHQTSFADDPLHPIEDSRLSHLLGNGLQTKMLDHRHSSQPHEDAIHVCDAETAKDIERLAEVWKGCRVATGAAPFGAAVLRRWTGARSKTTTNRPGEVPLKDALIVVGTCHPALESLIEEFRQLKGNILSMDEDLNAVRLPLLIRSPQRKADPTSILETIARTASDLFDRLRPGTLMLVGGESAQAVLGRLDIRRARPVRYQAGVARLIANRPSGHDDLHLFLKPGSYTAPTMIRTLFKT